MSVVAMYDYEPTDERMLSFSAGEVITVLSKESDDWWLCQIGERKGLVPANYVGDNTQRIDFPVHEAAKRGNTAFLADLLAAGASVNELDSASNVPLHWACRAGHAECVSMLLAKDPVLDQQNKLGDTPLHSAAWGGSAKCAELLLEHAAAKQSKDALLNLLTTRNAEGRTPSDLARNIEVSGIIKMFATAARNMPDTPADGADAFEDDD
ncbi:ankyrin repeat-containing domain protein [Hyaloraphidium curvatum]|nr:ankyrin repeat-containing domain protein [Hyaloraphidium curvatum]